MYKNFFALKERPFKLVPNPAYLFLSKSHEEVLAHLAYAVIQGDGFMEITGEVGTGKTTICRAFIEHLDNNTKAAYIFNPTLNSVQLLKAVNDEFGINSDADNTKDLIDTLNSFLIEQKSEGRNTILLIDEAQNLTKEVLEQLRLLSNLETANDKLLHIILVGQPELKETLNSYELRQLRQRISLSCRIIPLNYKELIEYIEHRIKVASRKPGIKFSRAAYRSIYKYSRGIPRLINIVCDRALLTAFGLDQQKITGKIVRTSIRELTAGNDGGKNSLIKSKKSILLFSMFCLIFFILILFRPSFLNMNASFNSHEIKKVDISHFDHIKTSVPMDSGTDSKITGAPKKKAPQSVTKAVTKPVMKTVTKPVMKAVIQPVTEAAIKPVMKPVRNPENFLEKLNRFSSRHMAIKLALKMWHPESIVKPNLDRIDDDQHFFRVAAEDNGLSMRRIEGSLNAVKKLNLPVVLAFDPADESHPVYLTLSKIDGDKFTLRGGKENNSMDLTPPELEACWSGVAYIPWKNFLSLKGTIPLNSSKESIITLKMLLRDIGFKEVEINPYYDDNTRRSIKKIQIKYGLRVDGAVGSTTKIALYNEKYFSQLPHIVKIFNSKVPEN